MAYLKDNDMFLRNTNASNVKPFVVEFFTNVRKTNMLEMRKNGFKNSKSILVGEKNIFLANKIALSPL